MEEERLDIRRDYEPFSKGRGRVGLGDDRSGKVGRVKVSPQELAGYNLFRTLEKYPEFTKEARSNLQNELQGMPGVETMNSEILGATLAFLRSYPKPTKENFKDEIISEYFTRLIPTKKITEEERKRLFIKLKALFLKYIVAIYTYRASSDFVNEEEEVEEEVENQYEDEEEAEDEE